MKIGIGMFITGYTVDPITMGSAVEAAGFDSIWCRIIPCCP